MKDLKRVGVILGGYLVLFSIFFIHKHYRSGPKLLTTGDTTSGQSEIEEFVEPTEAEIDSENEGDIYIHISGEVLYPGLLEVPRDSRLYEVVELAGGLTEDADESVINLAQVITDESKIYIPAIGEELSPNIEASSAGSSPKININSGTKEELMTLPGIGEKTADSIIKYRQENKFNSIEDIMEVSGIGEKKYQDIKDQITY